MKFSNILIMTLLFSFLGGPLYGQERFAVEFRPGLSFPLDDMAGSKLNIGYGFEFTIAYEVLQDVGVYAGWGWNKFDADNAFFTQRIFIEESGYTAGIQFKHRLNNSSFSYLIKGGAVYNHLELEDNTGEQIADSGHGLGWQAAAGISLEIGSNWDLRPTLRYRSLPGNIEAYNGQISVDLQHISLGVGLVKKF